jgi:hypothetical protein
VRERENSGQKLGIKFNRKTKLTPFLYGASSMASTSKSSAIARVGELSETPRISNTADFSRCLRTREKEIYEKRLRLCYYELQRTDDERSK